MQKENIGVVCGIDVGASTFKISVLDQKGFQIITNQANFRQTPSMVSYGQRQRLIGEQALIKIKSNFQNTLKSPLRLISTDLNTTTLEEQLKGSVVKFTQDQKLQLHLTIGQKDIIMTGQQIFMALLTKIIETIQNHGFFCTIFSLTVPSYVNPTDRQIMKKCIEMSTESLPILVDDWIAIAMDYAYFRLKQLQKEQQPRFVLFIDSGYSKFCAYVCQISRSNISLLTYQTLKFSGSRNMDHLLFEFYADKFKEKTSCQIRKNPKSIIKLYQNIEKSRKILSANTEHNMSIECLMGEEDLEYCMKREQFENIIMPVMGEMATALNSIQQTLSLMNIKLKSIELLGGATRIPFFQQILPSIFNMQTSRTLNATQSLARGANIYSALQMSYIKIENLKISIINLHDVQLWWNDTKNGKMTKNIKKYKQDCHKSIFSKNQKIPCQNGFYLQNQGQYEIALSYDYKHEFLKEANTYFIVKGPCLIRFQMTQNKTIQITIENDGQTISKSCCEITEQQWKNYVLLQKQLKERDQSILSIYHKKNQYQSLLYKAKEKMGKLKQELSEQEYQDLELVIQKGQFWVQEDHDLKDIDHYNELINDLSSRLNLFSQQKQKQQNVEQTYQTFVNSVDKALKTMKNKQKLQKIQQLKQQIQQKYKSKTITVKQLQQAKQQLVKICIK